jgi:hypothetical protein
LVAIRNGDLSIEDVCTGCSRRRRFYVPLAPCGRTLVMASSFTRFHDHTQRRNSLLWTSDQLVARLLPENTKKTDIHDLAGFEPAIAAGERP